MYHTKLLSQKRNTQVSKSLADNVFYVYHNNLMLYLTEQRFHNFKKLLNQYSFDENSMLFPDGEEKIVIQSPNYDIRFVFTEVEFEDLKFAIDEAIYMNKIYSFL